MFNFNNTIIYWKIHVLLIWLHLLETRCDTLSAPRYSTMECSNGNFSGSVCSFRCQEGYKLIGDRDIQCDGQNGTWSSSLPMCQRRLSPFRFLLSRSPRKVFTKSVLISRLLTVLKGMGPTGTGGSTVKCWLGWTKLRKALYSLWSLNLITVNNDHIGIETWTNAQFIVFIILFYSSFCK